MDKHKENKTYGTDELRFFAKQPSKWPRVVFIEFVCLVAVVIVAYSTFEIGLIVTAVIVGRAPSPDIIILLVLIPVAVLVQLP